MALTSSTEEAVLTAAGALLAGAASLATLA